MSPAGGSFLIGGFYHPITCPASATKHRLLVDMPFFDHTVPAGFEFDGASVPRFFWRVVSPGRPWGLRASCGHDDLYEKGIGSKKHADYLFREALLDDREKWLEFDPESTVPPEWLIQVMFRAVVLGGKGSFDDHLHTDLRGRKRGSSRARRRPDDAQ